MWGEGGGVPLCYYVCIHCPTFDYIWLHLITFNYICLQHPTLPTFAYLCLHWYTPGHIGIRLVTMYYNTYTWIQCGLVCGLSYWYHTVLHCVATHTVCDNPYLWILLLSFPDMWDDVGVRVHMWDEKKRKKNEKNSAYMSVFVPKGGR